MIQTLNWRTCNGPGLIPKVRKAPTWSWLSHDYGLKGVRLCGWSKSNHWLFAEYVGVKEPNSVSANVPEILQQCPVGTLWLNAWTTKCKVQRIHQSSTAPIEFPGLGKAPWWVFVEIPRRASCRSPFEATCVFTGIDSVYRDIFSSLLRAG